MSFEVITNGAGEIPRSVAIACNASSHYRTERNLWERLL